MVKYHMVNTVNPHFLVSHLTSWLFFYTSCDVRVNTHLADPSGLSLPSLLLTNNNNSVNYVYDWNTKYIFF